MSLARSNWCGWQNCKLEFGLKQGDDSMSAPVAKYHFGVYVLYACSRRMPSPAVHGSDRISRSDPVRATSELRWQPGTMEDHVVGAALEQRALVAACMSASLRPEALSLDGLCLDKNDPARIPQPRYASRLLLRSPGARFRAQRITPLTSRVGAAEW